MNEMEQETNNFNFVPICGQSEERNREYLANFSPEKYWKSLVVRNSPIIFDIGAHRGESVRFFKEIFPDSIVYSFEPDPDNFSELEALVHSCSWGGKCLPIKMGISEKEGKQLFYRQNISHLGSLIPINMQSRDSLGYAAKAENKPIEVDITTVDAFCNLHSISRIDILKIDVQGHEIGVLTGAIEMLGQTSCCTVEVSFYDFYEKSTSLLEVEQIMSKAGHKIFDISKISKNPKNFRTDWVELVYCNGQLRQG